MASVFQPILEKVVYQYFTIADKERKKILKGMKGHVSKTAQDRFGSMRLLESCGIREVARTGRVALTREFGVDSSYLLGYSYPEVEEILELLKSTWRILGITETIHHTYYAWVLFCQFVMTREHKWADKQLADYHLHFPEVGMVSISMLAKRLLQEEHGSHEVVTDGDKIEFYVSSSIKSAFVRILQDVETMSNATDEHPLALLGEETKKLWKNLTN